MKKPNHPRFYRNQQPRQTAGQELQLSIEKLSHDGRGIARHRGKTVFVSAALPGETVKARITESRSKFDQARTLEVIEPSEQRVEPACRHYQHCGGCELQHLEDATQINFKQQQALDQLARISNAQPETIAPPLDASHWHYRSRTRLSVYCPKAQSEPVMGFRRRQSQQLVPIKVCPVLDSTLEALIEPLNHWLQAAENPQAIGHIELIASDPQAAVLLRHMQPLSSKDLEQLQALCDQQQSLLFLQDKGTDSIHCPASPGQLLRYRLKDQQLQLTFSPADFTQINPALNQKMVNQAIDWLQPNSEDRILDLFCGLGNFSLPLAQRTAAVIGIEGASSMVERATANAAANQLPNAHFYSHDLTKAFTSKAWFQTGFNKILLDPPRAGAQQVVEQLCDYQADILYVSCDPATLARDAGILCQAGYRLSRWGVMNMFPQTTHVESMALFQR